MGFRKALYDVEEKGLNPKMPHRTIGPDGRLAPESLSVNPVVPNTHMEHNETTQQIGSAEITFVSPMPDNGFGQMDYAPSTTVSNNGFEQIDYVQSTTVPVVPAIITIENLADGEADLSGLSSITLTQVNLVETTTSDSTDEVVLGNTEEIYSNKSVSKGGVSSDKKMQKKTIVAKKTPAKKPKS